MTLTKFARMPAWYQGMARWLLSLLFLLGFGLSALPAFAVPAHVSEANLVLPNLRDAAGVCPPFRPGAPCVPVVRLRPLF